MVAGFVEHTGPGVNVHRGGRLYTDPIHVAGGDRYRTSKVRYVFETTDLTAVRRLFPPGIMFAQVDPLYRIQYRVGRNPNLLDVKSLQALATRVATHARATRTTYRNKTVYKSRRHLLALIERVLVTNSLRGDSSGNSYDLTHAVRGVIAAPVGEDMRKPFRVSLARKCGGTQYSIRVSFYVGGLQSIVEGPGTTIWIPLTADQ
jgi:hypothetical protein